MFFPISGGLDNIRIICFLMAYSVPLASVANIICSLVVHSINAVNVQYFLGFIFKQKLSELKESWNTIKVGHGDHDVQQST